MPTGNITKKTVDACQPGPKQSVLWDSKLKGFGLLVMPSGTKSYIFQYRIGGRAGRVRRYTIGRHGSPWAPEQARQRAADLAAMVRVGVDPIDTERTEAEAKERARVEAEEAAQRTQDLNFASYADGFIDRGLKAGTRERTSEGYASTLKNHITPVLRAKALPEITKQDIVRVLDRIPRDQPSVRRITFAVLRLLFNWAKGRGDIEASPLEGLEAPSAVASRDRVLSDEELALALRAAAAIDQPFGPFYRLLFATGQRRDEVSGITWAELDRPNAMWVLPRERSKNGEANDVPLNQHAVALLDQMAGQVDAKEPKWPRKGLVFTTTGKTPLSGYSRAKGRLDAKMLELMRKDAVDCGEDPETAALSPWRLHDARRTLATAMQRLGIRFEVVEAVLNHTAGASRSGVAAVYQRHGWGPEKRAALDAWAEHCNRVLAPVDAAANVVPITAARVSTG